MAMERKPVRRLDQVNRISDADRHQAVELLRHHCGEGILTLDEFGDRVALVYDSRTRHELDDVLSDLPTSETEVPETRRRRVSRWFVAILGGHSPSGRFRLSGTTNAVAVMGGCEIDLRNAEIDGDEVVINALALMGGIEIYVPEGISVDFSGLPLLGGTECKIADVPTIPGSPRVIVRAVAVMGAVEVHSRKTPAEEKALRAKKRAERSELLASRARAVTNRRSTGAELPRRRDEPTAAIPRPSAQRAAGLGIVRVAESVAAQWSSISSTAAPEGTVTVVFSEIDGFSALVDQIGEHEAVEVLRRHNEIADDLTRRYGGWRIAAEDEAMLVAFGGASRALRFAKDLQRDLSRVEEMAAPVQLRMALHTGEADGATSSDFLDRVVLRGAALGCEAAAGEILASGLLRDLAPATEFHFARSRSITVHRGEPDEASVEVAALEWR